MVGSTMCVYVKKNSLILLYIFSVLRPEPVRLAYEATEILPLRDSYHVINPKRLVLSIRKFIILQIFYLP